MLNFLSFNIQAGIGTERPRDYLFRAHRQVLPVKKKTENLRQIAELMRPYDVVCLQEVDLGGFRSGYVNQAEYLKEASGFPFMATQVNRRLGRLSLHGNVIFSKLRIQSKESYVLPGSITGRGLLITTLAAKKTITIANTHFSLGEADQIRQFAFVEQILGHRHDVILSGDFNCTHDSQALTEFDEGSDLDMVTENHHHAFPSWKPEKAIDHIFVSKSFGEITCEVLNTQLSDHLPLSMKLKI